jgi:hypothetical protein
MGKDTSLTVSLFGRDVSLGKAMDKVGGSTKSASKSFDDMAKKAAVAFAAISGMAILAAKNAAADAASQRILALTLKNTANATDEQIAATEEYINKTSLALGIADDKLRPAFARLTRSTNDVAKSQELMNLALDISASTGKPVEDIANALGKAYDGNAASLGRLGLGVDANILKSKDFNKIFNTLTKTFDGFAEGEANTTEGKMRRLGVATDELKESFGYMLLPYVEKMADAFAKMLPFIERNKKVIAGVAIVVGVLSGAIVAINMAFKAYVAIVRAVAIVQWALNSAFLANPITWIVVGVVALIALFVVLYKKSETFRNMLSSMVEFFKKIPSFLISAGKGILNALTFPWRTGLNFIGKIWNSTLGKLKFKIPDWVPIIGGNDFTMPKMPKIPAFAKGGIVNRPTIGLIGEAGPEAVVPLNRGGANGLGTTIHLHIAGSVIAERDLVVKVRNEIAQLMRRRGADVSVLGI